MLTIAVSASFSEGSCISLNDTYSGNSKKTTPIKSIIKLDIDKTSINAPFDGIIGTAAPQSVPTELLKQLGVDGVLVIPIGGLNEQELRLIKRVGDTEQFDEETIETVKFVPLLGGLTFTD